MNKNRYRIIFSKAKNMFIAVAENIKSQSKATGQSTHSMPITESVDSKSFHQLWQVKSIVASMSLFMAFSPVYAQMQADPNAAASQRAIIGVGQNQQGQNVPVVNIQTPKNGVSHNVYNQFDVLQPGVVLNNSRNGAGSVIVGQVGANPYLQTGEARVILNEVNSAAASRFEGNLEVAGQRADVIIANPSGINIQGGGFINANKAIFTTGKPQLNEDGSIKQFVVDQGKINVGSNGNNLGLGGNNNNADYVDIYAKAVELNAQVHANQALQVVTGSNTISDDLSSITPNQDNSTTPTFALDVKALGGMYANNIFIIGTDKGLGVSNAGTIQSPQTLVITSAGKIENTGAIQNTNPQDSLLSISTRDGADIVSSGSMITNGNLFLESGQNITLDKARLEKHGADNQNIISVSAKGDVSLQNSANVQNFGAGGDIYVGAQNISIGNDVNIGGNGGISFASENNTNIQNVRNISSTNDIIVQAKNSLNIENSSVVANNGSVNLVSLGTEASSLLNLSNTTLRSAKDFNLSSANNLKLKSSINQENGNNINIYAGANLDIGDIAKVTNLITKGDINITSNADLNAKNINISSQEGGVNLESKLNLNISPFKEIIYDPRAPDIALDTYRNNTITGLKGVNLISSNLGRISLENMNIKSQNGNIQIHGGSGVDLTKKMSNSLFDMSFLDVKSYIPMPNIEFNQISSKGFYLKSNKDLNIQDTSIGTVGDEINLEAIEGGIFGALYLKSDKNIEIFSNKIDSKALSVNSGQHVALKAKDSISLENSTLNANGILSLVSGGIHTASQTVLPTTYDAGAILLEAKKFNQNGEVSFKTKDTDILKNDTQLNKLNGSLSIQTEDTLEMKPILTLNAFGDLELVSKNGDLVIEGQGGTKGKGSENLFSLISEQGGVKLEGNSVSINAAKINSEKNIEIISSQGNLKVDVIKNTFQNRETLFKSREFLNDYESLKIAYRKADGSFTVLENEFFKKYPVAPINVLSFMGIETTNFTNLFTDAFFPVDQVYKFKAEDKYPDLLTNNNGYSHIGSQIISNSGGISLKSKKGVSISGSELIAKAGIIDIEAQAPLEQNYKSSAQVNGISKTLAASIIIDGTQDFYDKGNETDGNYIMRTSVNPTVINGFNGVNIRTVGTTDADNLVLQATGVVSQNGDVKIESFKNILFDTAVEQSYDRSSRTEKKKSWGGLKKKYITTKTENNNINAASVEIQAKNIFIESKEVGNPKNNIDIYSGKFDAEGKISIRSGGNINFYTADESSSSAEDVTKKSSFAGIKYNSSKSNSTRSQASQIPATLKADYIGVKSDFDTRLVGTEFEYLKGATIESGGTTFVEPAISNITELLKKEKNSVVWQSMQDKGSVTETGKLPSFNGPTSPVFKADGGISVQIPVGESDQNKVQIRDEILRLANQPGNQYLKDFVNRNDVDWNKVILAQNDWNYEQEGLTGAGAAIIVIIVTVLTYGGGTAAAAGAGVSWGSAGSAALTSLKAQAAISLVNNKGDIGKTVKDLGSKETVKNMAVAAVTQFAMEGINTAWSDTLNSTGITPTKFTNFINDSAQVVGKSLVEAGINGGSFSEALEGNFLNLLSSTLQANLSSQIKIFESDTLDTNYFIHKVLHGLAGCASAAIKSNDCGSGAFGSALGEMIVEQLPSPDPNLPLAEFQQKQSQLKELSKLAVASVSAYAGLDVNVATQSAELAIANNRQLHSTEKAILRTEAKKLVQGKVAGSEEYWYQLLQMVAFSEVDSRGQSFESETRKGWMLASEKNQYFGKQSLEKQLKDLEIAQNIVKQYKNANIVLKNGQTEVIDFSTNKPLKVFISTNEQFNDPTKLTGANYYIDPDLITSNRIRVTVPDELKEFSKSTTSYIQTHGTGIAVPDYTEQNFIGMGVGKVASKFLSVFGIQASKAALQRLAVQDLKGGSLTQLDGIRSFLAKNKIEAAQNGSIPYLNTSGKPDRLSIATAQVVDSNGTKNYLAINGDNWHGNAPDQVTINNIVYQVIRKDNPNVLPNMPNGDQFNGNHAEKKIMAYLMEHNSKRPTSIVLNIQNTSQQSVGACQGCGSTVNMFIEKNPNFSMLVNHGSTRQNP